MNNRWQEIRQVIVYVAIGIAALIVGMRFGLHSKIYGWDWEDSRVNRREWTSASDGTSC
jgi:hypothetical protein